MMPGYSRARNASQQPKQLHVKTTAATAAIATVTAEVTINVPLIWKVREIIFLVGKTHNGTVRGIFRGGRDLFDP
jgi:hypothetical protein